MGNTHQAQKCRLEADALKTKWSATDEYQWGYGKERGPDTWWVYYPAASGNRQSPINISPEETTVDLASEKYPLKVEYPADEGNKMIWNTGQSMQVEVRRKLKPFFVTGGPLRNTQYELAQFHLHWGEKDENGSEHAVNGLYYAMEIHFIHWNTSDFFSYEEAVQAEDGIVILAVFADLDSRCNSSLDQMMCYMSKLSFKRSYADMSTFFDIKGLLPKDIKKYWTYKGSMSTPPCYESATWIIFQDTITVSPQALRALRTLHNHCPNDRPPDDEHFGYILKNARNVQPMGTRKVQSVDHSVAHGAALYEENQYPDVSTFTTKEDFTWSGGLKGSEDDY